MSWRDAYRSRLCSADEAVASVIPGQRVYLAGNAATPRVLAAALSRRAGEVGGGLVAGHVLLLGDDPLDAVRKGGLIRHHTWFVGPADRQAVAEGVADYVPCHLSEIPRLLRDGTFPVDVALLTVSPPDAWGFVSVGVEVLASLAAARAARRVVVQVNRHMPRVRGETFLHVSELHAIVEADEPLPELASPPPTDVERAIARNILPLVPEGATLQLGIGGIPNAVVALLEGRTDLGVHSEMISDGVMRAVEAGVVTGTQKTVHPRKVITTFALGTRALYDWMHENPVVEAHPCDVTNDVLLASQNARLTSINSAISVDLTGQVNADSIGTRIYSGVGGQVDFVRAATRSPGGRSIIALPSLAKGHGRIVGVLAEGAGVVTSRADVDTIVTEHGVAELRGRSLRERAEALIRVAHPEHRDALRDAARARRLL